MKYGEWNQICLRWYLFLFANVWCVCIDSKVQTVLSVRWEGPTKFPFKFNVFLKRTLGEKQPCGKQYGKSPFETWSHFCCWRRGKTKATHSPKIITIKKGRRVFGDILKSTVFYLLKAWIFSCGLSRSTLWLLLEPRVPLTWTSNQAMWSYWFFHRFFTIGVGYPSQY